MMTAERTLIRRAIAVMVSIGPTGALAQHAEADELSLSAKGANVFRVTFPNGGQVARFDLRISFDGDTYYETGAGLPRAENLFRSIQHMDGESTIFVPVIAGFEAGKLILASEGSLWIQWRIETGEEEPVEITQLAAVNPTTPHDAAFLARLAEPVFLRRLFGDDFFDQQTDTVRARMLAPAGADERALHVVAQLLKATRFNEFSDFLAQRKSNEQAVAWADELSTLAFEFADSTYAPYAAYYAGGCYSAVEIGKAIETVRAAREPGTPKDRVAESEHRALLLANGALTPKAEAAYAFAVERADAYLKPRVLLHFGILKGAQLQQEEASRLWNEARQAAPGDLTIEKPIDALAREFQEVNRP